MLRAITGMLTGEVLYYGLLALVGAGALALVFGVRGLFAARVDVVGSRMRRTVQARASSVPPAVMAPGSAGPGLLDFTLKPFAAIARPGDAEQLGRLRSRLSWAGYRSERALLVYLTAKLLLALSFAGAILFVNSIKPQPTERIALYTGILLVIGFYAPNFWLSGRITERQKLVSRGLPDALDLLVTCVEAGLGLDLALGRVSREIHLSSPLLSDELTHTSLEMRAGVPRGETFRRLAARTGVEDIKNLSSIVIQTEIFGTSIAKSLRVMSEGMRIKRMQRAEEQAAMVAVKMTLPLIVNIMPALFCVLLGPAAIRIVRMLVPTLTGNE